MGGGGDEEVERLGWGEGLGVVVLGGGAEGVEEGFEVLEFIKGISRVGGSE